MYRLDELMNKLPTEERMRIALLLEIQLASMMGKFRIRYSETKVVGQPSWVAASDAAVVCPPCQLEQACA